MTEEIILRIGAFEPLSIPPGFTRQNFMLCGRPKIINLTNKYKLTYSKYIEQPILPRNRPYPVIY